MVNDGKAEKIAWTSLKFILPVAVVGGGLWIAYDYFTRQSKFEAAKIQWELFFNAYANKFESFNADGTLTVEESEELDRERELLNQAQKDLSAAVNAPDPIEYAVKTLSIAAAGALFIKYGAIPALNTLKSWLDQEQKAGKAKTQYATIYEMAHMADALAVAQLNPILATQKMTAAQTMFQNYTIPKLQDTVNFLQTHMSQFTGINLLYAQFMVTNVLADVTFISQSAFPFAFSLLPIV